MKITLLIILLSSFILAQDKSSVMKVTIKGGKIVSSENVNEESTSQSISQQSNSKLTNRKIDQPQITSSLKAPHDGKDLMIDEAWIVSARSPIISFNCKIYNMGTETVPANSFAVDAYLSTDESYDAADISIWRYIWEEDVQPYPQIYRLASAREANISGYADGRYYVIFVIDATNNVAETNESNNITTAWNSPVYCGATTDDTDFRLTRISINSTTNPVSFSYTLRNATTYTSVFLSSIHTGIYASLDTWVNKNDYIIDGYDDPVPDFGGEYTRDVTALNITGILDGTYYIGIVLDDYNNVVETNEGNNYGTNNPPITIFRNNTDLYPFNIYLTDGVGPEISYSLGVNCQSNLPSVVADVKTYLSTDNIFSPADDILLNTWSNYSFIPGIENILEINNFSVSSFPNGSYYLLMVVDPDNLVAETNESANTRATASADIIINNPSTNFDLSITIQDVSDAIGPDILYNVGLFNLGITGTIPGNTFYINAYLSYDANISTSDFLVDHKIIDFPIPPGYSGVCSWGCTITGVPDGNYYLGYIADAENAVIDVNRANNTSVYGSQQIQVGNPTADNFDLSLSTINLYDNIIPDINYDFTITNNGTAGNILANSFYVGEFLSADATISIDDYKIAEWLNPTDLPAGGTYYYNSIRGVGSCPDGQYYYGVILDLYNNLFETNEVNNSNYCAVNIIDITTGVKEESKPVEFNLFQNFPNPFNPITQIRWQTPNSANTSIKIFDCMGKEICTLVDEVLPAGYHKKDFNTKYYNVPSGVYYYQLVAGNYISTKKMIILK